MSHNTHTLRDFAWSIDDRKDPEIVLACDASLDEGDAIMRATFAPGLGSTGTEYFAQLDRWEARALLVALDVCEDGGGDDVIAEQLANVRTRVARLLAYAEPRDGQLYRIADLQAPEPDQLPLAAGVRLEFHPEPDSMGFPRVDLVGSDVAIIEYLRTHWGTSDRQWYANTVEGMEAVGDA